MLPISAKQSKAAIPQGVGMSDQPNEFASSLCINNGCQVVEGRMAELQAINAELEKVASYSLLKQNEKLKSENERLQGALRQIRNSLGAYRHYEVSVYLEDADNAAKLALDSSNTAGGG